MTYFNGQTVPAHKDTIMVHCLDTPKGWRAEDSAKEIMAEVRRWHVKERGWRDVAYAALIAENGGTARGRDLDNDGNVLEETGAGAVGYNKNVIHLALAGGKGSTANDLFSDHFTPAQDTVLRDMIEEIQERAGRKMKVIGHNDVAAKACPGFQVGPWLKNKPVRTSIVQSGTMQSVAVAGASTAITGGLSAFGNWSENAQMAIVVCAFLTLCALGYIGRSRIKKWVKGVR